MSLYCKFTTCVVYSIHCLLQDDDKLCVRECVSVCTCVCVCVCVYICMHASVCACM